MASVASMALLLRKSSSPSCSPFCLLSRSVAFSNLGSQTKERLADQMDADGSFFRYKPPSLRNTQRAQPEGPGFLHQNTGGRWVFCQVCSWIYRESSGAEYTDDTGYGDPVQKAEAMAFRRPFSRLGLVLLLYQGDMV